MSFSFLILWFFISSSVSSELLKNMGPQSIKNVSKRSVGSDVASIENYPYMASIRYTGGHVCGGTILSENIILTSGHCVDLDDSRRDLWYVKVGHADINYKGSWHKVERAVSHEEYQQLRLSDGGIQIINDIGLIKLKDPIVIDNVTTKAIELFEKNEDVYSYTTGVLAGWGVVPKIILEPTWDIQTNSTYIEANRRHDSPSELRAVELSIGSEDVCSRIRPEAVLKYDFCTHTLGKIPCSGDSGSPLAVNGKQAGIFTLSREECHEGLNSAYFINVAKYREWIEDKMKKLQDTPQ